MADVRCPADERRLFFKVLDDGSLEVACKACRAKRRSDPLLVLVLHRYAADGELLGSRDVRLEPLQQGVSQRHAPR